MATNYNDERLVQVEAQKNQALAEVNNTYNDMINKSDGYYQAQIDASKQWADKQTQLQQEKTDFAIEQIEQQKEQAEKDYTKEQSASYVDWQKESNRYGANAEAMASNGFVASGYGESSQVSMYNTYQNRVASARESYQRAVLNYDNAIKDAQLQNNSILAEIAYTSLQQQLELSLQGFQYKNTLVAERLNTKLNVDNTYHSRYMDVLNQINTENALAEQQRQFNQQLAEEQRQYNLSHVLQEANSTKVSGSSSGGSTSTKKSSSGSSKSVSSGSNNVSKTSGSGSDTIKNAQSTGKKISNVLTKQYYSALGLNPNSQIVVANGKYYAKDGGNYVDLTPVKAIISTNLKLVGSAVKIGTK